VNQEAVADQRCPSARTNSTATKLAIPIQGRRIVMVPSPAAVPGVRILDNRTRLHHAQSLAVLNHSRALSQGDAHRWPTRHGCPVGRFRHLKVVHASDVLDDAVAGVSYGRKLVTA
jgi:hypothetical protein